MYTSHLTCHIHIPDNPIVAALMEKKANSRNKSLSELAASGVRGYALQIDAVDLHIRVGTLETTRGGVVMDGGTGPREKAV